ncbi:MAG: hypothetical protein JST19_13275 [Bacteroidetes bacterium]|nr:hypothetical protein [Bacteroidota bacterium]
MDDSFFKYLEQLELLAFFSGYSLIYTTAIFISGNLRSKTNFISRRIKLLPFAYALVGTLYLGFELKKIYPVYSFENVGHHIHLHWLVAWGLLSVLFWIPALSKRKALSLIHSLVFFFLILKDIVLQPAAGRDDNIVANDMRVFGASLLLNLAAFLGVILGSALFTNRHKHTIV